MEKISIYLLTLSTFWPFLPKNQKVNGFSRNYFVVSRFGIGRFTTEEEVVYTANRTIKEVKRLREMSPLWEMIQDGIDIKSIQWSQH